MNATRGGMTAHEVLIAARALINTPEKWLRGRMTDFAGCYCLYGAIGAAAHCSPLDWPELIYAMEASCGRRNFVEFNDDPITTHADVLAALDRAIAAAAPVQP